MARVLVQQAGWRSCRLFLFLLAAFTLVSMGTQPAGATPLSPLAPRSPMHFASHGQDLGLQPGALYASIDPVISWNTFLGGSGSDEGRGVAVDGNGNIYVAGWSYAAWGKPIRPYTAGAGGQSDVFVAKFSPDGALLWNTFLGGDGMDWGDGIDVDMDGNVYVGGESSHTWGAPLQPFVLFNSSFVAKLNSDGALLWNTFMGSGLETGSYVAVDKSGNIYVSGTSQATWGSPLRDYSGRSDLFVAKLNSSGTRIWNTFLGGDGNDWGGYMAVDAGGNVYIAGDSPGSWGSPRRDYVSGSDAFAAKLDTDGVLIWNTFLGGVGNDHGAGVAVDENGNVYMSGVSNAAWGEPRRDYSSGEDALVAKLNSNGDLTWNTFLGGSGIDHGIAIALGKSGGIFVAGHSNAAWGSPIRPYAAGLDAFAANLNSSGMLVSSTFLGGSGLDVALGIALDGKGYLYLVGYSDTTWGAPISPYTASDDAFVAKIEEITLDRSLYLPLVAR